MRTTLGIVLAGLAGCLLSLGVAEASPGSIHGKIVDGKGRPIAGAIVTANDRTVGHTRSVYSDQDGRYALGELPAVPFDLRARHFGYKETTELGVKANGQSLDLRLVLETDEFERLMPAKK